MFYSVFSLLLLLKSMNCYQMIKMTQFMNNLCGNVKEKGFIKKSSEKMNEFHDCM